MSKRKTNEEFQREVFDLVGDEYTFLDTYVNARTKLKVKHNKCGHIYKVKPSHFLKGSRCIYCAGNLKKTDEQFKKEIYDLVGNEYTFLDTYVNNKTKLKVKHNRCDHVYKVSPHDFLDNRRCPYCSGNIKKTNKQFEQEIYDLVKGEYVFLDTYVNAYTKIKVKHNKCGHVYKVKPNAFLNGSRCPYCYAESKHKDNKRFEQEVYDLVGDEYTFLDTYVNTMTKLRVRHNKCGSVYKVTPNRFISGTRCPYCNVEDKRKTNNQFKEEVHALVGDDYVFLDTYVNNYTKLKVKHNRCGHIYEVRPNDFLHNQTRCPYCSISHGEDLINKILKSLEINYEYQKAFDDLRDIQPLSYDFYIPDQSILIEYQGQQHYEPVDHFGGDNKFKLQQKHDQMKSDYAKSHHYNLIAVPYTEDTFSKIKRYLIRHGLSK